APRCRAVTGRNRTVRGGRCLRASETRVYTMPATSECRHAVMTRYRRLECLAKRVVVLKMFFFQAKDGIRGYKVTGVQTCALPIWDIREDERVQDVRHDRLHLEIRVFRVVHGCIQREAPLEPLAADAGLVIVGFFRLDREAGRFGVRMSVV